MRDMARGALTGVAAFALGFVVLALVLPPPPDPTASLPGAPVLSTTPEPLAAAVPPSGLSAQREPVPEVAPEAGPDITPEPAPPAVAASGLPLSAPPAEETAAPVATDPVADVPDAPGDGEAGPVGLPGTGPQTGPVPAAAPPEPPPDTGEAAGATLPPARRLTPGSTIERVRLGRLPQIRPEDSAIAPVAPAAVAASPSAQPPSAAPPGVMLPRRESPVPAEALPSAAASPQAMPPEPGPGPAAAIGQGRLPQLGTGDAGAEPVTPPLPSWQRHRTPVDTGGRPRLGLVLLDPGNDPLAETALTAWPGPVTVALDPFDPDAPRRAEAYHAQGHEVVLTLDGIAPGVRAGDLDVLFTAWAEAFPQALGVIELPPGDSRRARMLAPRLVPVLADLGLALVAPDRGLSPLLAAARGAGLPVAGLYRQIGEAGADVASLSRQLDRAGAEAERTGAIAIFARADQPATLTAIGQWLGSARAARIVAVPVGSVLAAP